MTAFWNYAIEANVILAIFAGLYVLLLRNETQFRAVRYVMLLGLVSSLVVPLIHFDLPENSNVLPALQRAMATQWLPSVTIGSLDSSSVYEASNTVTILLFIYFGGLLFMLARFLVRFITLLRLKAKQTTHEGYSVVLTSTPATFSFFNTIFIGGAQGLSESERQQVIAHELVHVRERHSLDILLVNLLQVIFWFNPFLSSYKKIFVQLHEFEADARAVENQDVDRYCELLARVAIQSAGLSLANHFNNSLTVKRIQMMRTLKKKITSWKIATVAVIIPLLFGALACQDQLDNPAATGNLPKEAEEKFEAFRKEFPGKNFIVEYTEEGNAKLMELEKKYGKAKHIELFTLTESGKDRTFSMLQYERTQEEIEASKPDQDGIYSVVDELPEFPGGMQAMGEFLMNNLQYPLTARQQGIEGTSYIQFVVETDGTVTRVTTMKGFDKACDSAAENVVKTFPKWIPGKHDGKVVPVRFIVPIRFRLG